MAGGTRGTNTQAEALQALLRDIADMKSFADADIEWLLGIETQILQKLREPVQQAIGNSDIGAMSGMTGPTPATPPPPMGGGMGGPGVAGLRQSPGAPNPDELRRLLSVGA